MKKFFKKTEGFTLVELIVVIAILGILAGVGTVGYSGYIKKANIAADQQLLGFVNQAFSAACIENGLDQKQVAAADDVMSPEKSITGVTVTSDSVVSATKATDIAADFGKYFAGNEENKFKVVSDLQYSAEKGFYSNELGGGVVSVRFGGVEILLSAQDIQNLKNSAFNQEMTMSELMGKVELATTVVQTAGVGSPLADLASGADAQAFLMSMLGSNPAEQEANFGAIMQGLMDSGMEEEAALKQMQSYNVVLMASQSANAVKDDVVDLLLSDKNGEQMKTAFVNAVEGEGANAKDGLAQIAMAYGMYTSYIARYPDRASDGDDTDPYAVLAELGTTEFKQYMETPEAQTDLAGYLSSMNMINTGVTGKPEAVKELFMNGFSNEELVDVLVGLTGN